jgi:hypothetical protein
MAETIPGGAYLSADGKTWHDAHGNTLSKEQVAEAEALLAEQAEAREAEEAAAQERLMASQRILVVQPSEAARPARVTRSTGLKSSGKDAAKDKGAS